MPMQLRQIPSTRIIIPEKEYHSQPCYIHTKHIEPTYEYIGNYTLTGYCGCAKCCGKSNGITSTGVKAKAGRTIAVDPKKIPYGTEIVINGHTYVAEDCGGAIKGKKIDIFFDNHKDALAFGKKKLPVYVKGGLGK